MPFIQSKVNVKMTKDQEERVKSQLGEAIQLIPGKSENWLMVGFEDECNLYFKGSSSENIAFVEVKLFGKGNKTAYDALTNKICKIYNDVLKISPSNIYVKYEEVSNWGWNGGNF